MQKNKESYVVTINGVTYKTNSFKRLCKFGAKMGVKIPRDDIIKVHRK